MSLRPRGNLAWLVGTLGAVAAAFAVAALPVALAGGVVPRKQAVNLDEHPEFALKDELPVDLDVTVEWITCGSYNGFWTPHRISLCKENVGAGQGFANYVFLHELGHEAVYEYNPKLQDGDEATADSFAVVMAVALGHEDDILAAAAVFDRMAKEDPWQEGDTHPPLASRAATWRCMIDGKRGSGECSLTWHRAVIFWYKAIMGPKAEHYFDALGWRVELP